MQELHQKLLETMDVFHSFCVERELTYYMLGGTMLGAYRHQGFIPWDDDMDIGMPRKDYERLLCIPEAELPKGYAVRNHRKENGVPYAFTHFEDKNTTYIEQRRSKDTYAGGVYLEIFPLDEAAAENVRKWNSYRVRFYKRILYGLILDYHQKYRSPAKAICIHGIRAFCSVDRTTEKLEQCIWKKRESRYYSNLLGHWGLREDIPKSVFGTPRPYRFEGREYFGAACPEAYLTALYGENYMTPPTESEKAAGKHPAAYMNLQLPYEIYAKTRDQKNAK